MKLQCFLLAIATLTPLLGQTGGGGFGGPAVLGRGAGSGTGQRGGADLGIGYFAGVMGTIDSGLTGLSLDSKGNLLSTAGKGVDGYAGVYGSKRLRRGSFGINYAGHYRQYSGAAGISGTDQSLSLYFTRQLTKRSTMSLNTSVTTTNRPFGFSIGGIGIDPGIGTLFSSTGEIFDNRVYSGVGGGEYTFQRSSRLSFSVSGQALVTRRTGNILFGVNGAFANATAAYRITRRQTVSLGYQFFTYNFTRNFGDTYGQGATAGYALQLGKRAQLGLQGGFFRLESLGVRTATIDPVIAALIGQSSVQEVFHSISIIPSAQASLQYKVSRFHNVAINGGITASPGNGVINTSRNTTVGGSYTYSGIRSLGISANGFYTRLGSLIAGNQVFETINLSGSVSRRISNQLFATATAGNRRFLSTNTISYNRSSYFASAGLTWSPREVPISIR